MQNQMPIWVEYFRALGTPFAALVFGAVAAWISYQQWQLSKYKYRFDLFDRRYKVYVAIQDLFNELMQDGKISGATYSRFAVIANEARFLFDDEVDAYLKKVVDAIFEKQKLERKMARQITDDEFKKLSGQDDENWDSIFLMMKRTPDMFSRYLKIPR